MRSSGREVIWWPFTQHGTIKDDSKVTLIDSASGDNFQVLTESSDKNSLESLSQFDACASWWTQGLGHGESSLALAAAAAAGRYGHTIFPDVIHAPALKLSRLLVGPKGPGHGWASRVFFTDDGSTAMEVGIKMGMKTYQKWHDVSYEESKTTEWAVCAQQDCYHGDTLGVMDVAEPSVFNEGQHPWYEPKGLFLPTPTLGFQKGALKISFPKDEAPQAEVPALSSIEEAMDVNSRRDTALSEHYHNRIHEAWDAYEADENAPRPRRIGSVVIEPILLGAGGMKFVDPLWQRSLMDYARVKKVPVVFDEVASGLYRVGVCSCREILGADPDIASYAKLLTGGLLPLSVTLASEDVFNTFLGDEKGQALLHGHSYTAHPVGCVSSIQALETYAEVLASGTIRNLFDNEQVKQLSYLPIVQQSFALGTVLSVTVRPDESGGTGYAAASRTVPMAQRLRSQGVYVRPLGNVLYIMASPVTSPDECKRLCTLVHDTLHDFGEELNVSAA
jgi:dethiobiotin synthetase/adenosylmethionine--8-amino-7-oxononanoate aminotransferase